MTERDNPSVDTSEEMQQLLRLSDGGMQYLACNGIANNETVPEDRRVMFKQLAVDIFDHMPKPEKDVLIEYISWKSRKLWETRKVPAPRRSRSG